MKKSLIRVVGIFAVLALALMSLPVSAAPGEIPATVTVNGGGGGSAPIVKAKWEQSPGITNGKANETGDPTHAVSSPNKTQIMPPLVFDTNVRVQYWAVVTDPEGNADVSTVLVDVFHPAGLPLDGSFKYQKLLVKQVLADGIAAYNAAKASNLIYYNTGYSDVEVQAEFFKQTDVSVWMVEYDLYYEQPAGAYKAVYDAFDFENHWASQGGTSLENFFDYIAVAAIEVDFNSFNYGSVNVNMDKWINGNTVFDTLGAAPSPVPATVRNIGNVQTYLTFKNDGMGFGFNGTTATSYSGATAPTPADSNWNVYFDLLMGPPNPANVLYFDPGVTVTTPNALGLSTQDELDLSIHVIKSLPGAKSGTLTLGAAAAPWSPVGGGVASHP